MSGREPLRALTGLRFLAAFHVVVHHFGGAEHWPVPEALRRLGDSGHVSVTLFFVLSGFVLTWVHADGGAVSIPWRPFMRARLARIWPVYALGLVVAAPLFIGWSLRGGVNRGTLAVLAGKALAVLLMLQAWIPPWALSWNAPAWSISSEMFFYVLFPLLAPRLLRLPRPAMLALVGGAWMLSLVPPVLHAYLGPAEPPPTWEQPWRAVVHYLPLLRLPDFLVGILAARFFMERAPSRPGLPPDVVVLLCVAVMALVIASGEVPDILWRNTLFAPLFAVVVHALARGEGVLARALSRPPWERLGDASYALYILHAPVMFWALLVVGAVAGGPAGIPWWWAWPLMPLMVLLSVRVFLRFEVPWRARLRPGRSPA